MSNNAKVTAFTFDPSQVKPDEARELLKPEWYIAEIADIELKAIKGPNGGKRISVEFHILSSVNRPGEDRGRRLFGGMNVQHKVAETQEIGNREFSTLCHAAGVVGRFDDLSILKGKQVQVKVKTKPAKGDYEEGSEPSGFKPVEGAVATAPAGPPGFAAGPPAFGAPPLAGPPLTAPPAPLAVFPPAPWQPHANLPAGQLWNPTTNEVLTETDLKARLGIPAAPAVPVAVAPAPVPVAAPVPAPAPLAAPVAAGWPAPWVDHPSATGQVWNQQTNEVILATDLQARLAAPAAVAPAPVAAPPVAAAPPFAAGPPAPGSPAPWSRPPGT